MFAPATTGAVIMGRRTFEVGEAPWGEDGTFHLPCFVVTHRPAETRVNLRAGLLDEIQINLVPVLLGAGTRLFEHLGTAPIELERTRMVGSSTMTHLTYRLVK